MILEKRKIMKKMKREKTLKREKEKEKMEANRASAIEYICYAVKWASMYNAIT